MADGGECVAEFAIVRGGVADSVGSEQRKVERSCDCDGGAVANFFVTVEMALQFDVDIFTSKQIAQLPDALRALRNSTVFSAPRESCFLARPAFATAEAEIASTHAGERINFSRARVSATYIM